MPHRPGHRNQNRPRNPFGPGRLTRAQARSQQQINQQFSPEERQRMNALIVPEESVLAKSIQAGFQPGTGVSIGGAPIIQTPFGGATDPANQRPTVDPGSLTPPTLPPFGGGAEIATLGGTDGSRTFGSPLDESGQPMFRVQTATADPNTAAAGGATAGGNPFGTPEDEQPPFELPDVEFPFDIPDDLSERLFGDQPAFDLDRGRAEEFLEQVVQRGLDQPQQDFDRALNRVRDRIAQESGIARQRATERGLQRGALTGALTQQLGEIEGARLGALEQGAVDLERQLQQASLQGLGIAGGAAGTLGGVTRGFEGLEQQDLAQRRDLETGNERLIAELLTKMQLGKLGSATDIIRDLFPEG